MLVFCLIEGVILCKEELKLFEICIIHKRYINSIYQGCNGVDIWIQLDNLFINLCLPLYKIISQAKFFAYIEL